VNIKIIGLGGIGSILVDKITKFSTLGSNSHFDIVLIDGDKYEEKNKVRQDFIYFDNKAKSKTDELNSKYRPGTISKAVNEYISSENIQQYIKEDDMVFVCVDNHASRKLISDYASTLSNITIISGGNDWIDGNVQVFIRENGINVTPSLTAFHPEIENPPDKHPDDMSCEELSKSDPQLYFTNLSVATIMCWVLYALTENKFDKTHPEIYFDLEKMATNAPLRVV